MTVLTYQVVNTFFAICIAGVAVATYVTGKKHMRLEISPTPHYVLIVSLVALVLGAGALNIWFVPDGFVLTSQFLIWQHRVVGVLFISALIWVGIRNGIRKPDIHRKPATVVLALAVVDAFSGILVAWC